MRDKKSLKACQIAILIQNIEKNFITFASTSFIGYEESAEASDH